VELICGLPTFAIYTNVAIYWGEDGLANFGTFFTNNGEICYKNTQGTSFINGGNL
jgi:hypothetical protein